MRFYIILVFILVLPGFAGKVCGQNYLSLRSKGRVYKQYIPGREISVTVNRGDFTGRLTGYIDSIGDDLIFVGGERVYLQNIVKVHILRSSFSRSGGINLMLGGALLSTLIYTNNRDPRGK